MDQTSQKRVFSALQQEFQETAKIDRYFTDQICTKKSNKENKFNNKIDPEALMNKTYISSEKFPNYFQMGVVEMQNGERNDKFRVFYDQDLGIHQRFLDKIQFQSADEDCQTDDSQIRLALRQNKKDLINALYHNERLHHTLKKSVSQMEESLFLNHLHSRQYSSQPQQVQIRPQIIYYTQPEIYSQIDEEIEIDSEQSI